MALLFILSLLVLQVYAALTFKGADWSSVLVEEAAGKTFKSTSGAVQPLETILKNSGVNTVRQRLWVNPSDGNYNLAYNIKLAKRAQAVGLNVYLDMHFSDTWADPAHQV
jgi:arabinogalactan endo-1,4-beta-galactosidase